MLKWLKWLKSFSCWTVNVNHKTVYERTRRTDDVIQIVCSIKCKLLTHLHHKNESFRLCLEMVQSILQRKRAGCSTIHTQANVCAFVLCSPQCDRIRRLVFMIWWRASLCEFQLECVWHRNIEMFAHLEKIFVYIYMRSRCDSTIDTCRFLSSSLCWHSLAFLFSFFFSGSVYLLSIQYKLSKQEKEIPNNSSMFVQLKLSSIAFSKIQI